MESVTLSRRGFLRGRMRKVPPAQRPPWALAEDDFISRCTRCDACVEACPTLILVRGEGGFPSVDFSKGECSFCTECVTRCEPRALLRTDAHELPWALAARIGDACIAAAGVECRVCGESCPVGAIRFRPQLGGVSRPQLDVQTCTGCGACFAPCPTRAIAIESRLDTPMESEQ